MVIAYWKLILLTLAITELAKDDLVKDHKVIPWVGIAVAIVVSLAWSAINGYEATPALARGVTVGLITTGLYKLVKDYIRAARHG